MADDTGVILDRAGLCQVDTVPGPAGPIIVLRVTGEVDLLTSIVLRSTLDTVLSRSPQDVVLDLTDIRFCSVQGIRMMTDTALTMQAHNRGFALCGLTPHLDRIIELVFPGQMFVRYSCSSTAVDAARVDQSYRLP